MTAAASERIAARRTFDAPPGQIFAVIDEAALKGTLGILDRTVRRGYPRPGRRTPLVDTGA